MDTVTYALLKKKITSALTGIASIKADDEHGKLIFETTDGTIFTVNVPGGVITENFVVSNGVGKAEKGTEYKAGTALASIVVDMLSTYTPPSIIIDTNLGDDVFDKIDDSISNFKIISNITQGTKDINSVTVYINNNIVETYTGTDLKADGKYVTNYTFNPATQDTFIIKVTVNDGENTTKTKTISFVGKSYWGFVGESIITPTDTDVKGLQFNTVKNSRSLTYSGIQVTYGKVLYAYPTALGALSKIVDEDGRNYTGSYEMTQIQVDGLDYYCYLLIDAMGTDDGYQKFS